MRLGLLLGHGHVFGVDSGPDSCPPPETLGGPDPPQAIPCVAIRGGAGGLEAEKARGSQGGAKQRKGMDATCSRFITR